MAASSKAAGKTAGQEHGKKATTKALRGAKRRKPSRKVSLAKQVSHFWLAALAFAAGLTAMMLVWTLNLSPVADRAAFSGQIANSEPTSQAVSVAKLIPSAASGQRELRYLPTNTLFMEFNGRKQEPYISPQPPFGAGPRLVVIIDDLGENLFQAKELASLHVPVTFAILPQSSKTREVAQLAAERGRDVLLHQPMEPRDYPFRVDPGPGALFVGMADEEIKAVLAENLAQIPQAIGVNNHMGSRFTADSEGMGAVFQELKERGLFFLDSLTTSDSVALAQARRIGLPHLQRHIFLDNVQDVQAILLQLRKAESLALFTGEVIAIGHPYPETLEALKIWEKERDMRIQLVSVSDLLPRPALARR